MHFLIIRDPCGGGNGPNCGAKILAQGVITKHSPGLLEAALKNKNLPPSIDVYFDSPGGDLISGMRMGRILREAKTQTFLKTEPYLECAGYYKTKSCKALSEKPICYSACSYAFLGGAVRTLEEGAQYGLHQFRGAKTDSGESVGQSLTAIISLYLDEMGVDRRVLDIASLTRPNKIQVISHEEAIRLNIDNTNSASPKWEIGISNSSSPYISITRPLPGGHRLNVFISQLNRNFYMSAGVLIDASRSSRSPEEIQKIFAGQSATDFKLIVDGSEINLGKSGKWQPMQNGSGYATSLQLPVSAIKYLLNSKVLEIRAAWPNAHSDLDPSAQLGVDGLNTGLRIISR